MSNRKTGPRRQPNEKNCEPFSADDARLMYEIECKTIATTLEHVFNRIKLACKNHVRYVDNIQLNECQLNYLETDLGYDVVKSYPNNHYNLHRYPTYVDEDGFDQCDECEEPSNYCKCKPYYKICF